MKLQHSPTYLTSLQLYVALLNSKDGYSKTITIEQANSREWDRRSTEHREYSIRQELTIVEHGVLRSLGANALKLTLLLMDELKMNNALWYFKATSPPHYLALRELRDRHILLRTEDSGIHYVNPMLIRRGTALSVVAQTTHILHNMSRVTRELIRDLSYDNVKLSQMDQLNL